MLPLPEPLTPEQIRAARALLAWSQQDLATKAGVGVSTVADVERGQAMPMPNNADAIRKALEGEGMRFVSGGVVLQAPSPVLADPEPGRLMRWINATDLAQWGERRDAQGDMPELLTRLIYASVGPAAVLRFPAGDSVQHPGPDGACEVDRETPFVPTGRSVWEIGCQRLRIREKAEGDYAKRSDDPAVRADAATTTFVFATPQRFRDKAAWIAAKKADGLWRDVRVVDADDLVHWLDVHPAVAQWLAIRTGRRPTGLSTLDEVWEEWSSATETPLTHALIRTDRDEQVTAVRKWLFGAPSVVAVQAEATDEAMAFLHAAIADLPPPHRTALHSRCVVADTDDVVRGLVGIGAKLVVVMTGGDPGLAGRLAADGHHVYAAYGSEAGLPDAAIRLARLWRYSIETALEALGLPWEKAQTLAAQAGRSLAVLRRLMPAAPGRRPSWADAPPPALLAAMLAGAWRGDFAADRRIVADLAGVPYEAVTATLAPLAATLDGPLRRSGPVWNLASLRDAWFLLAPSLTDAMVDRMDAAFRDVLGARSPAFDVQADERWRLRPEPDRASAHLRRGLGEAMIALGVFPDKAVNVTDAGSRTARAVTSLLEGADERLWWSLSGDFRRLAEAAPRTFLEALDDALDDPGQPLAALFRSEEGLLGPSEYLSDLLWALEMLAWSPDHLARVTFILARLVERDPGGRMANRPSNSLRSMFLTWSPQTHATAEQRFKVLRQLLYRHAQIGWKTLLGILPRAHSFVARTPRPQWRDFTMAEQEPEIRGSVARDAARIADWLLNAVGHDPERWDDLLDAWEHFSPEWRAKAAAKLTDGVEHLRDQPAGLEIREQIRELLHRHRSYADAPWAMSEEDLEPLDRIHRMLEPQESTERFRWLFDTYSVDRQRHLSREENERILEDQRTAAACEIFTEVDVEGILRFARSVSYPGLVGVAVAASEIDEPAKERLLRAALDEDTVDAETLALGMLDRLRKERGETWLRELFDRAFAEYWTCSARTRIALALPASVSLWERMEADPELDRLYWTRVRYWTIGEDADPEHVCQKLMRVGRTHLAIELLGNRLPESAPTSDLLIRVLRAMLDEQRAEGGNRSGGDSSMFSYYVGVLFQRLDQDPHVDPSVLASLEWSFFNNLQHSERSPRTLAKALATDAGFFVQLLSLVSLPAKDSGVEEPEPTDRDLARRIATQAYEVLEDWSRVPGSDDAGTIDGAALDAWVKEARKLCAQAGRRVIGDEQIGQILSAARRREGEVWPPEPVREIIEICRSRDIEHGFEIGVYNRRGVTTRAPLDGGAQERELAARFRQDSRSLAFDRPRTAAVLDRIAESYEHDARREDERAEQGEW
jgi:transcriptional regulator with XRE-family HTH domain